MIAYIKQYNDEGVVPKESEPLSFLEKSHCVPIILALDRNGMMNRNQLYEELNETINVVVKRIAFLSDCDLIFERTMEAKPFAKYIGLTDKGKIVADKLWEIKNTMETPGIGFISHLYVPLASDVIEDTYVPGLFDSPVVVKNLKKELKELIACPNCGNDRYLIIIKEKETWICFKCGMKSEPKDTDVTDLYAIERQLQ